MPWQLPEERPLIPFGGGIDSVVVVEETRRRFPDSSLFIVGRFDPIEDAAAVTKLPIVRASRRLDPQVLHDSQDLVRRQRGFEIGETLGRIVEARNRFR
mgnify:CR=1 FL=1